MKKKIARRWLARNKWKIAKFNRGHFETGAQFHKQYLVCKRMFERNILFRKFT
jgi:hypothetical protein